VYLAETTILTISHLPLYRVSAIAMSQVESEPPRGSAWPGARYHAAAGPAAADIPELSSMLSTDALRRRPSRAPDHVAENRALVALAQELAASPDGILQKLAETALSLCRAHSAGLSLLEDDDQKRNFHWRAIAGRWAEHAGGGTPRDFGPCGTVLDRNTALLCSHPERDFPYFGDVTPLLEEALLIPFYIEGEAVGTIWVVAHDTSRRFDAEDLRVMSSLATFAAAAYQTLLSAKATRRTEQELRDFVENASVAMHWVGPDGIILWANRTEMEMLGFAREEYIGHHIADFHVDRPVIDDVLRRLSNHEILHNYEARLRCKDGSIRHVLINSDVLWDGDKFIHTRCFTRDITERKQDEAQIAVLARETEHRSMNVLATVQAMVHLTQSDTADGLKTAIEGRIQALANVHGLFVQSRWTGADLRSLIAQEVSPYCQDGDTRVRIDGPDLLLEPNLAQPIAVTLHELATNAAKYGALSVRNGRVQIEWSRAADGRLVLRWTETGGPLVQPPTRQGFGTRVMDSMIRGQLKGELRYEWRAEGLVCELTLPQA
jgi:PAS domain S-box-containing protein